jgi:hypothetical protein
MWIAGFRIRLEVSTIELEHRSLDSLNSYLLLDFEQAANLNHCLKLWFISKNGDLIAIIKI